MNLFGVVYSSRCTRPMSPDDIDRLLLAARTNNSAVGVTGVLLHGDGQFFQYFEGARSGVDDVYERIRRSDLHSDLLELEYGEIPRQLFRNWFMGFREAPASVLQKLSQEHWKREIPWAEDHMAASAGIQQLMEFLGPVASQISPP